MKRIFPSLFRRGDPPGRPGRVTDSPLHRTESIYLYLALIIHILSGHFLIRVHRPAELPAFIDEYRHIDRAQMAFEFEQNPVEFSHGKLLFYYYVGLFSPKGEGALVTARLAVAIFSLLGGAASAGIARDLFGRRTMIPVLAFYALMPHTVFYERLALADSFAGTLGALAIWSSIRLVRKPSRRVGFITGILAAASSLAKLITAPLVVMPLLAALFLNRIRARSNRSLIIWKRYGLALNAVLYGYVLLWVPVVIGLILSARTGGDPMLLDWRMISVFGQAPGAAQTKLHELTEVIDTLLSVPMTILLAVLVLILLKKYPAKTLFLLSWLALFCIPAMILGYYTKARYLLIGVPALAVIFGGGMVVIGDQLARIAGKPTLSRYAAGLVLVVWGGLFALPFAIKTSSDPAALELPELDTGMFFAGPANAWGIREALDFLDSHGDRINGQIPVVGVLQNNEGIADYCGLVDLYRRDHLAWDCTIQVDFPAAINEWLPLDDWPFIYVVTDAVALGTPTDGPNYRRLFVAPRPHDGQDVSVWLVTGR